MLPFFRLLPGIVGTLGPLLLPPAHIAVLYFFWKSYSRSVDRRFCSCSCWDTVFKGTYESGIASYKHMYFNATTNTLKMWILVIAGIIGLYESLKYLVALLLESRVRYSMVLLFLLSIFSHYYAWWAYINYYNDDFYEQWAHQFFFTITELVSTTIVLHLANRENAITARKVLGVVGIALLHIAASGVDQFIENVFRGEGYPHQVVRDIGFMVPDVAHLAVPLWLLRRARKDDFTARPWIKDKALRREVLIMLIVVSVLFVICSVL